MQNVLLVREGDGSKVVGFFKRYGVGVEKQVMELRPQDEKALASRSRRERFHQYRVKG